MSVDVLYILFGGGLLIAGGELLVRGAASLARAVGVSPMVAGLTVVAYGTSAPEFVVSTLAAWKGNASICGGNIVGSNILNVLLVLGCTALVCPLRATSAFVRREVPLMIGVTLLFCGLAYNSVVGRAEGTILLILLVVYTAVVVRGARREKAAVLAEFADGQPASGGSKAVNLLLIIAGLVLLVGGSRVFLRGAVDIATALGVSEALIGLTLVAMGTSLPELVSSLVAAWRKHPDICLGNVIGSCTYNLLWIGGTCAVIRPVPFDNQTDRMLSLHLPVMALSAMVLWPIVATGHRISRREGIFLLVLYAGYLVATVFLRG
jgi:cation:H+ antiporter